MITLEQGESGYFSRPLQVLDPFLFDGEHLRPDARTRLNNLLLDYMSARYNNPQRWTMVWLAGSGISYQWAASRGKGDLDILFGIDYDKFIADNPDYSWYEREEIASLIDADLKQHLWPNTAHEPFYAHMLDGEELVDVKYFEVTFFLNQYVDADTHAITRINPYAAYNITKDEWTVRPPKLPEDPAALYPDTFSHVADTNRQAAEALVGRYNALQSEAQSIRPGSPQHVNNERHRALITSEARNLFDSIHLGRRLAFSMNGEGYGDFYNYQWQRAKQDGIVNALNKIIGE